jgi:hypothetical protein
LTAVKRKLALVESWNMRLRKKICIMAVVCSISGCSPEFFQSLKDTRDTAVNARDADTEQKEAWAGLSFKDTELYGLFIKHPYNTTISFERQFPRVALIVLDAPRNHSKDSGVSKHKACWRLRARLWQRRDQSKDIESFHWCTPYDIATDVPLSGAYEWFAVDASKTGFENTGNQRTSGPVPPISAMPSDLRHQKFWQSEKFGPHTMDGVMVLSLLYHMGFDWSVLEDRRAWVVEFSQARR